MVFSLGSGTLRAQDIYQKITSLDQMVEGTYLIVEETKGKAASTISGKFLTDAALTITNSTAQPASLNATGAPCEFEFRKNGTNWTIKNIASGNYIKTTAAKALAEDQTPWDWTIAFDNGNATVTSSGENHGRLLYNVSSPRFLNYTSATSASMLIIQLYKKNEAPAPCPQVSNVSVNAQATSVTLTWEAPEPAPANGYNVIITKDDIEIANEKRDILQYKLENLSPNTTYGYSIFSACSENNKSQAVTGTFSTKAADMPTLTVTSPENGHVFTSNDVSFSWNTTNFDLGDTKKTKIVISGNGLDEDQVVYTTAYSHTLSLEEGDYKAAFCLVEENESGDISAVEGTDTERSFTVRLSQIAPGDCEKVSDVNVNPQATGVYITWTAVTPEPAGYTITITEDAADQGQTFEVDRGLPQYTGTGLKANTTYHYAIVTKCTETLRSEAVEGSFTTKAAGEPSIVVTSPTNGTTLDGAVQFMWITENFELGADKLVKISISGGTDAAVVRYSDQNSCTVALASGIYTATFNLVNVNGNDTVSVEGVTGRREFSVNLPDVAFPIFHPYEKELITATEVSLTCTTPGATIYYKLNDAVDFTEYTVPIPLEEEGNYTFSAYAAAPAMDNSDTVSITYTLTKNGTIVFEEPFDKITATSDGSTDISSSLDQYTRMPGWSGQIIYEGDGGCVKMGTGSKLGYIQTPALDLSANEGKFVLSFEAKAFNNAQEKESFNLIVNGATQEVSGLSKEEMTQFVFNFTSGTDATSIRFSAIETSKNRFYLDNIKIYQVLPDVPALLTVSSLEMKTVQGTAVSQTVTVRGNLLDNDVTVTCPTGNFSVTPATLAKADVMSEEGAEFTVTYSGAELSDKADIVLSSGEVSKTISVSATASAVTEVATLADLRKGTQGELYRISGEVILSAMDSYRNYKWVEDATGGILIDDATGLVTASYQVGDGITGVYGKLGNYGGQLQLIMTGNLPEASSHNHTVEPQVVSIEELEADIEKYCSRLVRINDLRLVEAEGEWGGNTDNMATDANENTINIRTFVRNGSFVGTAKPSGTFDLIALAGIYNDQIQVSPRVASDILSEGGSGDECTAPTGLKVTVNSENLTATASWNGSAASYKVILLNGSDTLASAAVSSRTYTFGEEAEPNVEYGWAVASVCEDGSLMWTKGENFIIRPTANENAASLQADIYPNPNNGTMYIDLTENARMEVFTATGLNLRSEELTAGKTPINLNGSGIYFIRLSNPTGATVKRVVVR